MTSLEDAIGHAAQSVSLSAKEKAAGRHALHTAIGLGPKLGDFRLTEEERADSRAILQDAILGNVARGSGRSFFGRLTSFVRLPAVAMGLVLSTGLAVAANNSLPGDTLYPVKISVLEPVIGTLQPTSSLRAAWSVEVLHRRLWEIDELNTQDDIDKQIRLEKAAAQLHEQTQRVLRQAETLPIEDGVQIRRQAKRVLQETSDSIRNAISASSDDAKRVPLQTLLTVIEDNGRNFEGENSGESSSSMSSEMIASSASSAQVLRPLPGGVGVPDPAVITITIGDSETSEDSSSSEASDSSESSAPAVSSSSASLSSSIMPRPPVIPAEPIVPPPVRLPLEPSKPVVSSASSLSLSAPSIELPTGSLGL